MIDGIEYMCMLDSRDGNEQLLDIRQSSTLAETSFSGHWEGKFSDGAWVLDRGRNLLQRGGWLVAEL
jgi:hypothetical protein